MRVAISGCRHLAVDFDRLDQLVPYGAFVLVGDCPTGVDKSVRDWVASRQAMGGTVACSVYKADWDALGRAAGPIRNRAMVTTADLLVAFWDGKSRGTLSAITEAAKIGVPVRIYAP